MHMTKKFLLTGPGFIGKKILEELLTSGSKACDITVVAAPWEDTKWLKEKKFNVMEGDIRNKMFTENLARNCNIVYHLASKTGFDGGSYEYFKDTIVDGTINILKTSIKHKVEKFIFFSSTAVYGLPATAGDIVNLNESSNMNFSEGYGQAKVEAEMKVKQMCKKARIKFLIIRPTTVYGPGDRGGISSLIKQIQNGVFFFIGNAKNKIDLIFVNDLARIVVALEKKLKKSNDYIVNSGKPLTQYELVKSICLIVKKNPPTIFIPKNIALITSYVSKYVWLLFKKKPILFPNRVKVLTSSFYFDTSKIQKTREFVITHSLLESLQMTVEQSS